MDGVLPYLKKSDDAVKLHVPLWILAVGGFVLYKKFVKN